MKNVPPHPEKTGDARTNGKKSKRVVLYDTDKLAFGVHECLLRDFRAVFGKDFLKGASTTLLGSPKAFREFTYPDYSSVSVPLFKAHAQMETLLKKYRFREDAFDDDALRQNTLNSYFDAQVELTCFPKQTIMSKKVLQEARKIAKSILGKYSPEATILHARFGKKSSIGCPLHLAHIDYKLSDVKAFTGSFEMSEWFINNILADDSLLQDILRSIPREKLVAGAPNLTIESLILKQVPKSWKILRTITPLTLLGLYYSHGIGGQVTELLKHFGLDITRLQARHRLLVKKFSRTRTHVTADLRRASDSILKEHCNYILPRDWYVALKPLLTHQVIFTDVEGNDTEAYTASVLPMGNGATFPLETLMFYCIIKAIGNLVGVRGIFSAYGDDLIYPIGIHKYVVALFPVLGFSLNMEKTFATSHFRESCGADFYRGADVRPFTFPGEHQRLPRSKYLVELYKIYNGLTRRWDPVEIRSTLVFLLKEMALTGYKVMRVPPSYPDTAGIRVSSPREVPLDMHIVDWSPIWYYNEGCQWYSFHFMSERSADRFVLYQEPYYWLKLQGRDDKVEPYAFWHEVKPSIETTPELRWRKYTRYRSYSRNGRKHTKRITRYKPIVSEKMQTAVTEVRAEVSDWAHEGNVALVN